ncbi:MAG: glutamate synthase large subunit [Gaiellales bacterium]|jgi:glutamate synthase domain-containing protein 2/glutamate synthase domain-containing protein 1/glutamate synthase domain-containing protein 3
MGLDDPRFAHAACGLAGLARIDGRSDHELVERALLALRNLEHRGATGADPDTGDGAGILTALPDGLLRRVYRSEIGGELPPPGHYGVGMVFLPRDPALRLRCEELCVRICAEEGHRALGWRDVPVRPDEIGALARAAQPFVRQLFVERRVGDVDGFERALYVIRRRVELAAAAAGVPEAEFIFISLSARRMVHKGLLKAGQLAAFYPELTDPAFTSPLAIVHSRFSTNTLGTWDLAHPFGFLAHNGEINTVRGNGNWLSAREPQLSSELFGRDLQKLFPIADERWSDSAKLDAVTELLVLGGRSLPHALAMLVPAAWTDPTPGLDDEVRAFYEYHAALVEPWDGPAALLASDGRQLVAALDRNGLRPLRYERSRDGLAVIASEVGVAGVDRADVAESGRVGPGQMLVVDPGSGIVRGDREVKLQLARRRPYRHWLAENKVFLEDTPPRDPAPIEGDRLRRLRAAFGYTEEELAIVAEMASSGAEPTGSMGDDTPPAALSGRPRPLSAYFKQHFAQVTNPPIDPQREALVMTLRTSIGAIGNLLGERPADCRRVEVPGPVLDGEQFAQLRELRDFQIETLPTLYDPAAGADALERAIDGLCRAASRAVWGGSTIVILSDRDVDASHAAIPALLATAAVHSHLVREGARARCGLVVESGEPRESMQYALLLGYGAAAVHPYLALAGLDAQGRRRYIGAVGKGLLKICSKMGISTVQSYRGAQIFEAVGLGPRLVARYFPGTVSRVGGIGTDDVSRTVALLHVRAFGDDPGIEHGGEYRLRPGGERHAWDADSIVRLQRAVRDDSADSFRAYADGVDAAARTATVRGLLQPEPVGPPLPLGAVEPSALLVRRFASGAMSLGSISPEAHETLAVAMNRIGGRSNTGEGGEDPARSVPDPDGTLRRSAIKQVASGRFGVTAAYLVDADQLQIKIAQGAKPGEGGQLPGHKVDERIARLRHSTPGVGLISPPPHHDIYSIEDLAQLIHDLRCVSPAAEISVKLVAEAGVGTIAAGVAKARADHVVISGHDGGTGASPLSSIKHAGLPWELGLAEAQQVLSANALRDRVRLQVDGGLRTPRDVLVAAILGADEFAFSTAPLVAAGCVMMRVCHLNTCPVGIATQEPELRRRFAGTPEHVIRYFLFLAEGVRELLAELGAASLDEVVGRAELLQQVEHPAGLDLSALLEPAPGRGPEAARGWVLPLADRELIDRAVPALRTRTSVRIAAAVENTHRSVGAALAGEIARLHGDAGLPAGAVRLELSGVGGQSLGAFAPRGLEIDLDGPCNDHPGKGLCGGTVVIRGPEGQTAAGNTALYGATAGELFVRGSAGERFAVRNSGATAVVEGCGDHGCEYMTGGAVLVLGATGRNFAAGMSGGAAYLLDADAARCNLDTVAIEPVAEPADQATVLGLLERHLERTGSRLAAQLLEQGEACLARFHKVLPHDLKRALERDEPREAVAAGD